MKLRLIKTTCIVALCLFPVLRTQGQIIQLGSYDKRPIHFGIQLGMTQSKFEFTASTDEELGELLHGATSYYMPGFLISILAADIRLGNHLSFRCLPGVMLTTRSIEYSWDQNTASSHLYEPYRNVESVYGELPIELKYRALRWRNFRPYVTGGVSYGFDLASLRDNRNNTNESIIRLSPTDLRYTTGVGLDFFLRYVKFAIEFKMGFGLSDLKINDDDIHSQITTDLYSRTYTICISFEG